MQNTNVAINTAVGPIYKMAIHAAAVFNTKIPIYTAAGLTYTYKIAIYTAAVLKSKMDITQQPCE